MKRMRMGITATALATYLALGGCGGGDSGSSTGGSGSGSSSTSGTTSTVNLVVKDTPSTLITILSFQVQITGAVLQPGSVSLLPRPVTVDLAQLVSDTGFLASTVIDSATYTSLDMTFANPQVTLLNNTGAALTLAGQSCAAGATCTFVPALNTASVTISNGVFPLTLTASSSTGLNLDLSIPDLLQSDLSIAFASGTSVNLSLLPGDVANSQQAAIDDVLASITAVNGSEVDVTTALGDALVLTSSTSTQYDYPASLCAAADASCVAVGQIVSLDLGLLGSGSIGIDALTYVGGSGSALTKALVLSTNLTGTVPTAQVLVRQSLNVDSLDAGQIATVTLPTSTSFAIGPASLPAVSGATFAAAGDLLPGQEIILSVADLVTGTSPTFSSSAVTLEPSQVVGQIDAVDTGSASLTLTGLSGLFTGSRPLVQLVDVQTGSATTFVGLSPDSLAGLSAAQFIVAKGPLLNTSGSYPAVAATQITGRSSGN